MSRGSTNHGDGRLGRRALLKLGSAGLAAIGASTIPRSAHGEQTPGSGQGGGGGPRPPAPPAPESIVNPRTATVEDWTEPWIWRPSEWPGQPLILNLVGNPSPPRAVSPGNRFTPLYSWNGASPGPTIRVRGNERLRITVRNHLGPNLSLVPKGPAPDPFELVPAAFNAALCRMATAEGRDCAAPPTRALVNAHFHELNEAMGAPLIEMSCHSGPVNIPHASHTTNVHTHGLHVEPGMNANGTFGDFAMSRILPQGDAALRKGSCKTLESHERVGEGRFEYALTARSRRAGGTPEAHPPGTHWYHPHAHGATHDQVASGLAGFLIVEGDVDDAINLAMTGEARPDLTKKTGRYDYRERLILLQRVEVNSADLDRSRRQQVQFPPPTSVNGAFAPTTMFMRPGAVERWRVLNGSVDGRGFKQFMVLEGQFVFSDRQLWRVLPGEGAGAPARFEPATRQQVADATRQLYLLAIDGITLVQVQNGRARHAIKDLAKQNAGSRNPLDREPGPNETPARADLTNVEACYRDGESLRSAFVRPNQVYMVNANRADVIFQAPLDSAGKVYTILAQEFPLATDNYQQRLQVGLARNASGFAAGNPGPLDVVLGYVKVAGTPVEGGAFDVMSLNDRLPAVPPSLQPVGDDELRVSAAEATRRKVRAGDLRTRVVAYTGFGPTDFPLIEVPASFAAAHPELKGRVWDEHANTRVLLTPYSRTMAINPNFDLTVNAEPAPPRKFGHHDHEHPHVLVDTAEEWVLYNTSVGLWSHTDIKRFPQPGQYGLHYTSYPLGRAEGQARYAKDAEFQITTKGADHPFHIHINPMWVTRIDVPDEQGRLHNMLEAPCWMDTVSIPRGGRVVFRSRFAHYTGTWVNHCHILMHEDHGMMQAVSAVARAEEANYRPRARAASHAMSGAEVDAIYPPPSLELMYRQNMCFVDSNPETGQAFPGFEIQAPKVG